MQLDDQVKMKSSMGMTLTKAQTNWYEESSPRRGVGTVKEGRKVADAEESA